MLFSVLVGALASLASTSQARTWQLQDAEAPIEEKVSSKFANLLLAHNPMPASKLTRSVRPRMQATVANEYVGNREDSGVSYREQWKDIFSKPLDPSKPVAKPSPYAQMKEPTAKKVPFSDVYGTKMVRAFRRYWTKRDKGRAIFFALVHGLGALAPFYFSWRMLAINFIIYCFSGLGITYSYHRQLAHKSFKSPKWFEYLWAFFGMMGMQGAPLDWASEHRYHHLHTETPLDPHSIYEGFYFSHMGWLLDSEKKEERCHDMSNAKDMSKQKFYQFTSKYYKLFVLAHWAVFYAVGGMAGLAWRALFVAYQYHVTWFVNSAAHVWGNQEYRTGDQSRNNWWVGLLAFGEGWHNNHHAFEYSARHGLRKHQLDTTWMLISLFKRMGLVSNVKLPTEKNKDRLRIKKDE
jgi:stearoyl-CoA desaturase (delta-9 desaturase)